jgi:hypothetical protein
MRIRMMMLVGMLLLVAIPTACSRDRGAQSVLGPSTGGSVGAIVEPGGSDPARVRPDFDPEDFVGRIDNPFFPLVPGTVFRYSITSPDEHQTDVFTVTRDTKKIIGVVTTIVHDQVLAEDGSLVEDTFDYFAQDDDGNVWYFGEDTKEYENGVVVSTFGTWLAGVNGGKPGIIMLAHPRVGNAYQQEFAPGVAEDEARVTSLSKTVRVPYGRFTNCLKTLETTPLEPGAKSYKFYARGVGNVLEIEGDVRVELTSVTKR